MIMLPFYLFVCLSFFYAWIEISQFFSRPNSTWITTEMVMITMLQMVAGSFFCLFLRPTFVWLCVWGASFPFVKTILVKWFLSATPRKSAIACKKIPNIILSEFKTMRSDLAPKHSTNIEQRGIGALKLRSATFSLITVILVKGRHLENHSIHSSR